MTKLKYHLSESQAEFLTTYPPSFIKTGRPHRNEIHFLIIGCSNRLWVKISHYNRILNQRIIKTPTSTPRRHLSVVTISHSFKQTILKPSRPQVAASTSNLNQVPRELTSSVTAHQSVHYQAITSCFSCSRSKCHILSKDWISQLLMKTEGTIQNWLLKVLKRFRGHQATIKIKGDQHSHSWI